jgi:uncharacterized small protein (DUF1192 family)
VLGWAAYDARCEAREQELQAHIERIKAELAAKKKAK